MPSKNSMKIGIDLLWVRVGICGGTESFIRNLLYALSIYDKENEYMLFCADDNEKTFRHYHDQNSRFHIVKCPVKSMDRVKRIAWENLHLDDAAKKVGVDIMYVPVYSMPRRKKKNGISYITTIHDLQGMHYPEYFSKPRLLFLKRSWRYSVRNSRAVIAISGFTKKDILEHFPEAEGRVYVIPNTVVYEPSVNPLSDLEKYGIKKDEYFYCVSSLLPHKNLNTILETFGLRKRGEKLVISGVGGSREQKEALHERVKSLGIEKDVIYTGFVSDSERNLLYENCKLFLFPSVYEGFGMPPVEALMAGKFVVTTEAASIPEATCGQAFYVHDAYDPKEWSRVIDTAIERVEVITCEEGRARGSLIKKQFEKYSPENVAKAYLEMFERVKNSNG